MLSLKEEMEAILRAESTNNWITLVFLLLLLIIFILTKINQEKLKGVVFSLFNKGFIEIEVEEKKETFTVFNILLFLFFTIVLALLILFLEKNNATLFSSFLTIFTMVFTYFIIKGIVEFLVIILFSIQNQTKKYLISKRSYFYTTSFVFFIFLIVYQYGVHNYFFLISFASLFLIIRMFLLVLNNKNLIISELFYFILYLCAFEIAPLFILFKLIV